MMTEDDSSQGGCKKRRRKRAESLQRGQMNGIGDDTSVLVHIAKGDGETYEKTYSLNATVGDVKQDIVTRWGLDADQQRLYLDHEHRDSDLRNNDESLRNMRPSKKTKITMSVLMEVADAQAVTPVMTPAPDRVLGNGLVGDHFNQFDNPLGAVWVPSHTNWLITTEHSCVKITNVCTGVVICTFGSEGSGKSQFNRARGVDITSDSSLVVVADTGNERVQVLRLVMTEDGEGAKLQFVRSIVSNGEAKEKGQFIGPRGVAVLKDARGKQTVLVTDSINHVSQFALDTGTFLRIFAECKLGYITMLDRTHSKVAIADFNQCCVRIFDHEGTQLLEFGTPGHKEDGQLYFPSGIASDAHGNILVTDDTCRLQVFDSSGKHLCTRNDLGFSAGNSKGIAWGKDGRLAVANGRSNEVCIWLRRKS